MSRIDLISVEMGSAGLWLAEEGCPGPDIHSEPPPWSVGRCSSGTLKGIQQNPLKTWMERESISFYWGSQTVEFISFEMGEGALCSPG